MADERIRGERWLLMQDGPRDSFTNMAVDVAMVQTLPQPALRLYTWEPWAVSLGYHQSLADLDFERLRADGIDVVRRPTGGRAVLHAEELTYCVTLPASHPWNGESIERVYRWISEALAAGLRTLGLPVTAAPRPQQEQNYAHHAACFAQSVRFEIDLFGKKLVGSAQRRFPQGVLQHGSILIGTAHAKLPQYFRMSKQPAEAGSEPLTAISLREALPEPVSANDVARAVIAGFEQTFGIVFQSFRPDNQWHATVAELREQFVHEMQGDRTARLAETAG